MNKKEISELSILDFFTFAKKYWIDIFCVGLIGVIGAYYNYSISFKYTGVAQFSVISGENNHVQEVTDRLSGAGSSYYYSRTENAIIKYQEYFSSAAKAQHIYEELKKSKELHYLDDLVQPQSILNLFKDNNPKSKSYYLSLINNQVSLNRQDERSNILQVNVKSKSAEASARIANIALYVAIKEVVDQDLTEVRQSKKFINKQIASTTKRISDIEDELSNLQYSNEKSSRKISINDKQIAKLREKLLIAETKSSQVAALIADIKQHTDIQGIDYVTTLKRGKLLKEQLYWNTQINSLKGQLAKFGSLTSLSKNSFAQSNQIQFLNRQKEFEYQQMANLKKLNLEMNVKEVSIRNRARVLDYANPQFISQMSFPIDKILLTFLIAICLAVLFFTLKEQVSPEINNREDIENQNLIDFGTIPDFDRFGGLSSIKWTFNKKSDEKNLQVNSQFGITNNSPQDFAYGQVRSKIQYALNDSEYDLRVVTVTSPRQGEGKTHISGKLAFSLAKANQSVLLIDGDLIRKDLSTAIGLDQNEGFRQMLSQQKDFSEVVVKDVQLPNLHILPAGHGQGTVADALLSDQCIAFFEACREKYDVVIIDTPALLVAPDALLFARLSDVTTLVVSEGRSKMNDLKRAYTDLKGNGVDRIGSILNRTDGILKYVYHQPKKKKYNKSGTKTDQSDTML